MEALLCCADCRTLCLILRAVTEFDAEFKAALSSLGGFVSADRHAHGLKASRIEATSQKRSHSTGTHAHKDTAATAQSATRRLFRKDCLAAFSLAQPIQGRPRDVLHSIRPHE
jgi:hypothetical protein